MPDYIIESANKHCRVAMQGDLTAATAKGLQAALKQELNLGIEEMTFDLEQTTMLDSTGIGLLIAAYNTMARAQGKLRVLNVSPQILQLLQTMRLVTRLNVTPRPTPEEQNG